MGEASEGGRSARVGICDGFAFSGYFIVETEYGFLLAYAPL
jgi:hypothetical protein